MIKLSHLAYPAIALLSLAAAGAAFADDITPDNSATQVFTTTKTRAQVQAELYAARADGSIKFWSTSYNPLLAARSLKSRADVRAEREPGYAAAWYGEDSGSFALSHVRPSARPAQPLFAAAGVKVGE